MKKLLSTACLAALAPLSQADTLLGIYAGAGIWNADYSGDAGVDSIDINDLGLDDESNNFYYVALEHPVPLLPNIKLQHTEIDSTETGVISETFKLDDVTFTASEQVVTDVDLSHTDAVLYYEILDNWVSLDAGLTLRSFNGDLSVASTNTPALAESVELDAVIPLIYVKAQFDLPLSGFSIGADANIVAYSGNTLSDASARIAYEFESIVDLGLELGYRHMALEVDDIDDLEADLTIDGPYAAVTLHF